MLQRTRRMRTTTLSFSLLTFAVIISTVEAAPTMPWPSAADVVGGDTELAKLESVELDQQIGGLKLETMGLRIDSLTAEQVAYETDYAAGT